MGVPIGKCPATGLDDGCGGHKIRCPRRQMHDVAPGGGKFGGACEYLHDTEWLDIGYAIGETKFPGRCCHWLPTLGKDPILATPGARC